MHVSLIDELMYMLALCICEGVDLDFTKELEANFVTEELENRRAIVSSPRLGEPRLMPLHCNGRREYETSFVRSTAKKPPSVSLLFLVRVLTELVETEEALLMAEVVMVEKLLQREMVTVNRICSVFS